jgi:hypothetical protein
MIPAIQGLIITVNISVYPLPNYTKKTLYYTDVAVIVLDRMSNIT